ncbi:MAG TPA: zinc ribbon domain-containing protein [Bryobacteraceae bacterium]|nr:zinc ribbon domain-containing protein [Bryobacteraceae bacterium]
MEARCTCGAVLPEDARFCHKCGKPQFDEDIERIAAQEPAPPAPQVAQAPAPTRIGFGNSRAVLITMATAACSLVLLCAAAVVAPILGPLILCLAGFMAVRFYKRRTPEPVSPGGGAFLGLMTGLWLFLVLAICAAVTSIYISSPDGREMLRASMPKVPEVAKMLDDPHEFLMGILMGLIPTFFIATISAAFGGLLAARSSRGQNPQKL